MPEEEKSTHGEHGLEKVVMAAVGAVAKAVESAGEVLEELIKKGDDFIHHGKAVNEELKHKKNEDQKSDESINEEAKGE